jgi:hypothetical protein
MVPAVIIALAARGAAAQPAPSGTDDPGRCLTCHGMANLAVRESASAPLHSFSVSPQAFSASVHGRLTCQQCHGEVGAYPHVFAGGRVKVTCAQQCHAQTREGRPYTHAATVADFDASAHRARTSGDPNDRPTCLTCHGSGDPHAIAPASGQPQRARMALCVGCHDDRARMTRNRMETDAVSSYKRSFHYKAITFGARTAAVCQDCHTTHRILPPWDSKSSVAAAALPATCGQAACHPGARAHFAVSGANHLDLRVKRERVLWLEEWLFWILTAGTMAMLVAGIVLDVQKKFGWVVLMTRPAKRIGARVRRRLDALSVVARHALRRARWLLVG